MYPELKGKVALVTGASRGFGRAVAQRLAKELANVVVNYRRSRAEANKVVEEIKARYPVEATAIRADVGSEKSLDSMFEQINKIFGRLDILVANAAFGVPGSLLETNAHRFQVTMDASGRSLLSLAQRAVPLMENKWGRIVSITSEGGRMVIPGYGAVGVAKAALESITRYLAVELADKGIVVNGVVAGPCFTRSFSVIPGARELIDQAVCRAPMRRTINEDDLANLVAFLCSNEASMICGQFIYVDGGCSIVR